MKYRDILESRESFLAHKIKDIHITLSTKTLTDSKKQAILLRTSKLQSMASNLFQSIITIDGYIDSIVTMGVLQKTEQCIAASISLSAAEDLMSSLSDMTHDVNEMSSVLSEDICGATEDELLSLMQEEVIYTNPDHIKDTLPLPPTTILTKQNDRRTEIAIG